VIAIVVIFAILVTATAMLIYSNRSSEIERISLSLKDMSVILSRESDATFTLASTILEDVTQELKVTSDNQFADPVEIHENLRRSRDFINAQTGRPSFGHLFVIGNDGYNVANTVSHPAKRVFAGDRAYFLHHKANGKRGLHISQPLYSKVTSERVIFLTRGIYAADGTFCGVIGIQLKLSHFNRIYQSLALPPGGSVTLLRSDGMGIYRYPLVESFLEKSVNEREDFQRMLRETSGYLIALDAPYDGVNRILGFRKSNDYPILSLITVTEDSVLSRWLVQSTKILTLAGFAGLTLLILSFFTYRQLEHLTRAISDSNHDSLTRLWNRRAFDERFVEEWRRASRRGSAISLLFIDIDFFKPYNDLYGHRQGDECLQQIAQVLGEKVGRSGEMVARYGGEEFVVLLPQNDLEQAYSLAERMIKAVQDLKIPHDTSQIAEYVTISIGVACVHTNHGNSPDALLDAADQALYRAKEQGRNRVVS
jgi:diguanylate cyclase (GGDEF)-like protein